jgi:hypothetical protein
MHLCSKSILDSLHAAAAAASYAKGLKPYTLYPIPYTLNPKPYTLYPKLEAAASYAKGLKPYTLNPKP